MQQISSRLCSVDNLNIFQARAASFKCQTSTAVINPSKATTYSAQSTRTHLANLEKILQKQTSNTATPLEKLSDAGLSQNRGKTVLERLNMTKVWTDMMAAEDMSPKHSNHLNRLLSTTTEEFSPRKNLGDRWPEYHGSNDWAGLLDPLDENLRREVVKYGEFVQAAYHAFHSNPAREANDDMSTQHVPLPDKSYQVTKNIYATSSTQLPQWIDEVAPNLGWMTQRSSLIGYVAVSNDKEINRIGRRDIVIALRGTATCLEWTENFRAQLVPIENEADRNRKPKVECGFWSLYKTHGDNVASLSESVVDEVRRLIDLYKGEALSISVTGHSLGAALALLVANEISTCVKDVPPIAVFSIGGPQVGNRAFADQLVAKNVKVLRIVNNQDFITRVPGVFLDVEKLKIFSRIGSLFENMPLAYSHVGTEFRVDTKNSPYLKPNADIACCHDLEAYLHLVDGFFSSSRPFRPNAKRSLVRLLNDQRSNVKRLYTSKAQTLRLNVEKQGTAFPTGLPSPS